MEYYVKSVVPVIESNYVNFTTVEKNIADFFIQNRKKMDFSAKTVAEQLFVSEASLSRFAKKCDEVLLLPSLKHLNHGNVISPQFPILVMLDIIYSYYLEQDKYEKETLHDNTLRALQGDKQEKYI